MFVYLDAIKLFIIQHVMRINIKEVSNCEIPSPPIEVSDEEQKPISSLMFNICSQNDYIKVRNTLMQNE